MLQIEELKVEVCGKTILDNVNMEIPKRETHVLFGPNGSGKGSLLDVGSKIVLNAPETRAEIISRGISSGGSIIARGNLIGKVAGIKAHLECKGLILNDGLMQAIPELTGHVPGVEMSHEASVGKIDQQEIEYFSWQGALIWNFKKLFAILLLLKRFKYFLMTT